MSDYYTDCVTQPLMKLKQQLERIKELEAALDKIRKYAADSYCINIATKALKDGE